MRCGDSSEGVPGEREGVGFARRIAYAIFSLPGPTIAPPIVATIVYYGGDNTLELVECERLEGQTPNPE
jgi:hypothetical protein